MFDTIIKNGWILDGTGKEAYLADLGITDGKIAKIGTGLTGANTIDASSLTVSPGWIDAHSHSDNALLTYPDMKEKIEQGITLSITGHCGSSIAPSPVLTVAQLREQVGGLGSSAALLVGHGSLRRMVMGKENRDPSEGEMCQMEQLLEESLQAGAIGLSLGLYYTPSCYAKLPELIRLAKITAKHRKVLSAHIRNEGDDLIESVEELIQIATQSHCRTVLSHHKAAWQANWGKVKTTLSMIDEANAKGADIYMDVYPYTASATSMAARFIPGSFLPPGCADRLVVLHDPQMREQLRQWGHRQWGNDLSFAVMDYCPGFPEYEGLNLNQIAALRGESDVVAAILELLTQSNRAHGYFFMMCEEDVQTVLRHGRAMLCTDSGVAAGNTLYHPRLRSAFPRALRKYVRDEGLLSLPEMIRKMTSLPASVYGLTQKGRIAEGMDADLCIFDPAEIADGADYSHCTNPNRGLHYVILGGQIVAKNNTATGLRPGRICIP